MTDRPKWMPTHEDVEEQSDLHIGWVDDEAMQFLYRVGLRAQIAVLEEEDAHMIAYLGGTYTDENREWRQAKIAALRKEIGG